ncbi:hypothetical protein BGP84_02490 [Pseudomonas putida]|jgi:hypothetical protein|uniref:Uncharacterized protein n=1 Tax=Pseudomonas putida TaxID=303 RepID=A0A2S3XAQ7_PSEPU|nr:hypothetical protein BGP84_02490 [Pseudomonas putida]
MLTRSFTAQLFITGQNSDQRVGVTLSSTPAQSGWLTAVDGSDQSLPVDFRFTFILSESRTRLHYLISSVTRAGGYRGTLLNLSLNGYAGLYRIDAEETAWKVEPLNAWNDEADLRFHLRSLSGERLGRTADGLLNTSLGEAAVFKAKVIAY